jgi:hypothetical protein
MRSGYLKFTNPILQIVNRKSAMHYSTMLPAHHNI